MVASPHVLASASGVAALRAGGNALDAAIAAAATIAVVYPHMNGLGGDNVWLIFDAGRGALRGALAAGGDRRGRPASSGTPRARHRCGDPSRGGAAALTVPGVVDGWWSAHEYSRATMGSPLGWRDLLADAIVYAREGFSASDGQRTPPPREPDLFGPEASPEIRRDLWPRYHPDALARGRLIQTDLARTIEAIAAGGPEAFYRGDVGRRIVAAARAAGSPLAIEDFAEHRSDVGGAAHDPIWRRRGGELSPADPGRVGARDAGHVRGVRHGRAAGGRLRARPRRGGQARVRGPRPALDRSRAHAGSRGGAARARAHRAARRDRSRGAARCHPATRRRPAGDTIAIATADRRAMPCRSSSRSTSRGARRSWRATPASSCKIAAASSPSIRRPPMRSPPAS